MLERANFQRHIFNKESTMDLAREPRYVCLDFETNGFPGAKGAPRSDWTLPWSSFPIQLNVDIVKHGEVTHAMDTLIQGAQQFAPWVRENVPITHADLDDHGAHFEDVVEQLGALLRDGDVIVAHNVRFDLETVLARTASKMDYDSPALRMILSAPRFCMMRCAYNRMALGSNPGMAKLCEHFQVPLEGAHDARVDSAALAECVAEAWRRGVML